MLRVRVWGLRIEGWRMRIKKPLKTKILKFNAYDEQIILSIRGRGWYEWWLRLDDWGLKLEDWWLKNEW